MKLLNYRQALSPAAMVEVYVHPKNEPTHQLIAWISSASALDVEAYLEALNASEYHGITRFYKIALESLTLSARSLAILEAKHLDTALYQAYKACKFEQRTTPELSAAILATPKSSTRSYSYIEEEKQVKLLVAVLESRPDLTDAQIAGLYRARPGSRAVRILLDHTSAGPLVIEALQKTAAGRLRLLCNPLLMSQVGLSNASLRRLYGFMLENRQTAPFTVMHSILGPLLKPSQPDAHSTLRERIETILAFISDVCPDPLERSSAFGVLLPYLTALLDSQKLSLSPDDRLSPPLLAKLLSIQELAPIRPMLFGSLTPPGPGTGLALI